MIQDGQNIENLSWRPSISPTPPGVGQWSLTGKDTLVFRTNEDWRISTQYSVTVPAGSKGILDSPSDNDHVFRFNTPTLRITDFYPKNNSTFSLRQVIFVSFDQRVSPEAVLAACRLQFGKSAFFDLELAPQSEIPKNSPIAQLISGKEEGKWIIFRSVTKLPYSTSGTLSIGPDILSAEGSFPSPDHRKISIRSASKFSPSPTKKLLTGTSPLEVRINHRIVEELGDELPWVPIISPKTDGKWKVNSNGLLTFFPLHNWTPSTTYRITFPKGTKTLEEELEEDIFFEQNSPVNDIKECLPKDETIPLKPIFVVHFDQRLDGKEALKCIKLSINGLLGTLTFIE